MGKAALTCAAEARTIARSNQSASKRSSISRLDPLVRTLASASSQISRSKPSHFTALKKKRERDIPFLRALTLAATAIQARRTGKTTFCQQSMTRTRALRLRVAANRTATARNPARTRRLARSIALLVFPFFVSRATLRTLELLKKEAEGKGNKEKRRCLQTRFSIFELCLAFVASTTFFSSTQPFLLLPCSCDRHVPVWG